MGREVNELAIPALNSSKCLLFAKRKAAFRGSLNGSLNGPLNVHPNDSNPTFLPPISKSNYLSF